MDLLLKGTEIACIKRLAELFEKGECWVTVAHENDPAKALNLPPEQREAILTTLQDQGIIADVRHGDAVQFFEFKITSKAVQFARAIIEKEKEKEPPMDLVEQMKLTLRRKPLIAWPFMFFLVIVFMATAINQILQALKALGLIK